MAGRAMQRVCCIARIPFLSFRRIKGRTVQMVNKLAVAGPDSRFKLPDAKPAGFWAGYWHGLIAPITFVIGLFRPGVRMYETHNNKWYDLGFILGVSASLGGGIKVNVRSPAKEDKPCTDGGDRSQEAT
jgi:hypothetical protein